MRTEEVRTLYDRFMLDKNNLFPTACKPQSTACGYKSPLARFCSTMYKLTTSSGLVESVASWQVVQFSVFRKSHFTWHCEEAGYFGSYSIHSSVLIVVFSLFLCTQTLAFVDLWLCRISNPLFQFYINDSTSRSTTYLEIIYFRSTRSFIDKPNIEWNSI